MYFVYATVGGKNVRFYTTLNFNEALAAQNGAFTILVTRKAAYAAVFSPFGTIFISESTVEIY